MIEAVKSWCSQFRFGDAVRNLIYPLVPIFAVACVWSMGYACQLETKLTIELAPRDLPTAAPVARLTTLADAR